MPRYPITDPALRWIEVIFSERFGHVWHLTPTLAGYRLQLAGGEGSITFDKREDGFTQAHSDHPCSWWDALSEGWNSVLGGDLPAPGVAELPEPLIETRINHHIIHYDIPGLTYWMLARVEEIDRTDLDDHQRFPATASHACMHAYLDHPVVDEWLHVLGQVIQRQWPSVELKCHEPRTLVTCDVDSPFASDASWKYVIRRAGSDIIKRRSPTAAIRSLAGKWYATRGADHFDVHRNGLEFIMDTNERAGKTVAFYFIPEQTDPRFDGQPRLRHPRVQKLMREIHARGHEIGIHPGYDTYRHSENMMRSVQRFHEALDVARVRQPQLGGRQHFLRWEMPTTARLWDNSGFQYDTTLSFADRPGFRCGTCFEYFMFDAVEQRALRLRQRPLIVMECSVIANRYLGLGYSDAALELMQYYQQTCYRVGGQFVLLWHNSHFDNEADGRFYQALVNK